MIPKLMITRAQHAAALEALSNRCDVFDPVLIDERAPSGEICTIIEYDDESIMIQQVKGKEGFLYNIVPRSEFIAGTMVV